jgi:hypothetical protein
MARNGAGACVGASLARSRAGGPASTQSPSRAPPVGRDDVLTGQRARRQRQEQRPEADRASDSWRMIAGWRSVTGFLLVCFLSCSRPRSPRVRGPTKVTTLLPSSPSAISSRLFTKPPSSTIGPDPCDLSAWARQLGSPGPVRPLTPGSAACGSRRRVTTATRLASVGALAAAITTDSSSGTRTPDAFVPRRITGAHPFAGIETARPRAAGAACSAPRWRTFSIAAHPRLGAKTSGSSFAPLRPSIGSTSQNDRKTSPAYFLPIGATAGRVSFLERDDGDIRG